MSPVRVERMINSRRVHTVHEPVPFQAVPRAHCGEPMKICCSEPLSEKQKQEIRQAFLDTYADVDPMADEWAGAVLSMTKAVWCFMAFVVVALVALVTLVIHLV